MKFRDIYSKIFSIAIVLLPFLYQYASPLSFLSLGDFFIVFLTIIGIFYGLFNETKLYVEKNIIILSVILVLLTILASLVSYHFKFEDSITIFLKIVMYNMFILVSPSFFNYQKIKKIYNIFVLLLSLYLILQYIYTKITQNYLPIYLKHEWLFSWEKRPEDLNYYYNYIYYAFRPSSLFVEPGYFAFYVLPCMIINLIKEKRLLLPIIITISLILSTSGAGIAIGFIMWGLFFITKIVHVKNNKISIMPHLFFPILILGMIIVSFLLINTNIFSRVLGGSFNARIIRGFMIYDKMDSIHKIIGVGMNNISNYMNFYNIKTPLDEPNLNNGATMSIYLVQFGIIGLISLIVFIIRFFY